MSKNKKQPPVVELVSVPVVAHSRKLKARWTVEPSAKLQSIHGLTKELEETLARELDPLYDLKKLHKKAERRYGKKNVSK